MNITRRAALKGTAAVAAVAAVPTAASAVTLAGDDPLIAAAEEIGRVSKMWSAADDAFEKAADEAGYHSHKLELDFDMIWVNTKDVDACWSRREIEEAAERGNLTPKQRDHFLAKVDAMQNQAAQIRRETGLEPLAQEVAANRKRYWELRKEICETPANSIKGVLAKFRASTMRTKWNRWSAAAAPGTLWSLSTQARSTVTLSAWPGRVEQWLHESWYRHCAIWFWTRRTALN